MVYKVCSTPTELGVVLWVLVLQTFDPDGVVTSMLVCTPTTVSTCRSVYELNVCRKGFRQMAMNSVGVQPSTFMVPHASDLKGSSHLSSFAHQPSLRRVIPLACSTPTELGIVLWVLVLQTSDPDGVVASFLVYTPTVISPRNSVRSSTVIVLYVPDLEGRHFYFLCTTAASTSSFVRSPMVVISTNTRPRWGSYIHSCLHTNCHFNGQFRWSSMVAAIHASDLEGMSHPFSFAHQLSFQRVIPLQAQWS